MEQYVSKWNAALKYGAAFILLIGALIFSAPAKAASPRELTESLNVKNPVQLSYYFYYNNRPFYRSYYRPYYRPYYRGGYYHYHYYRW